MELLDIVRSIRRYWALTVGVILVFVLLGLLAAFGRGQSYEAEALVAVRVSDRPEFGALSTDPIGESERYVQNQLVVLESSTLATRVAEQLDGLSKPYVQSITDFEQVDGSDIIRVAAVSGSAEEAQEVANVYAGAYVELVREQIAESAQPQLETIGSELELVGEELQEVITRLDPASPAAAILAQERAELRARQTELTRLREELILARDQTQSGNRVLQGALLPDPSGNAVVILGAALFVGILAGAVAAVAYARITGRVLDGEEIGETLGVQPVAVIPSMSHASRRAGLFSHPLGGAAIHGLCVRVEAQTSGESLVVAVAGTGATSGVTTTAVAISAYFAREGLDTLLVDLDVTNPELSGHAGKTADDIATFLMNGGAPTSIDLPLPGVRFIGVGSSPSRVPRDDVEKLVTALRQAAKVVVIDCGSVFESATSLRLIDEVDAAVLAVPIKRQRSIDLSLIADDLRAIDTAVLPVITPVTRRRSVLGVEAGTAAGPGEDPALRYGPRQAP